MRRKLFAFAVFMSIAVTCVNEYNPFNNYSNANILIVGRSIDQDSIKIYSTVTCTLSTTVSELIDSFSVHAPGSRFWTDSTVISLGAKIFRLSFSFIDTGWKEISVTTFRNNGDQTSTEESLYVYSPLHQDDIDTLVGANIQLTTPSVGDSVWYHWEYTAVVPKLLCSRFPQTNETFTQLGQYPCSLWVSEDSLGKTNASPSFFFTIRIRDESGPSITILDSLRGDTIVTGNDPFMLEVQIYDPSGIKKALVNDSAFDIQDYPLYWKSFRNMTDFQTNPDTVVISAVDNNDSATVKTYHLLYDPDLPSVNETRITVENIHDTVRTGSYVMIGTVRDYNNLQIYVTATVNQKPLSYIDTVSLVNNIGIWGLIVSLDEGPNQITVFAFDTTGQSLAQEAVTIIRDSLAVDTTAPTIVAVQANQKNIMNGQTYILPDSSAVIRIVAYDESDIDSLKINGKLLAPGEYGIEYLDTVSVSHHDTSLFVVSAVDKAGNRRLLYFHLVQNLAPRMASDWEWPQLFIVGRHYEIEPDIKDDDLTRVILENAPASMMLEPQSSLSYSTTILFDPVIGDTGSKEVSVVLDDGLERSVSAWSFTVLKDTTLLVRFADSLINLPRYLEAGTVFLDTLVVKSGTGRQPFRYVARFTNSNDTILDTVLPAPGAVSDISAGSEDFRSVPLLWEPSGEDAGMHNLIVTVTDYYKDSDTLYREIEVVPENSDPCSIAVLFPENADTTPGGALDMRDADSSVTLTFLILDDDHPVTEHHTITVDAPETVSYGDDSLSVYVTVSPQSEVWSDTIRVIASDSTGSVDTIVLPVIYGISVLPGSINNLRVWLDADTGVSLYAESVVDEMSIVLSWQEKSRFVPFVSNDGLEPLYLENAVHEHNAVSFGTGGRLTAGLFGAVQDWAMQSFTIFCVARLDTVVEGRSYTLLSTGATPYFGFGVTVSGELGMFAGNAEVIEPANSGLEIKKDQWYIIEYGSTGMLQGANHVNVWRNGTPSNSPVEMPVAMLNTGYMVVGSAAKHEGGIYTWDGDIAEVIVFGRSLGENERRGIESHLAQKFGLTLER